MLEKSDGPIENLVQGTLWKNKIKPLFGDNIVLPLEGYFDDFEPCEAVGAHSGVFKLGAMYYTILSIPPEHRSSLDNNFSALIFHAQSTMALTKFFGLL